jgi:hypothetical protein
VGDSTLNPLETPSYKARVTMMSLYSLTLGNDVSATPYLQAGDTFGDLTTNNPSNNNNVIGLFFTSRFAITDITQAGA